MTSIQDFLQFLLRHWVLSSLFVVLFILLIIEEVRAKGVGGGLQVSPAKLTHMINREEAVVVDVRDGNSFKDGHIVGAINIAHDAVDTSMKKLEKYKTKILVLVCASGQQSLAVANKLRKQGFESVHVLSGGLSAWKSANYPVVKK